MVYRKRIVVGYLRKKLGGLNDERTSDRSEKSSRSEGDR